MAYDERQKRREIFVDTLCWIIDDPELNAAAAEAKKNTEVFAEDNYPAFDATALREEQVYVTGSRTYEAAMRLAKENPGKKIAVMNFASAFRPGGGVIWGSGAQEESLCRCSTLYPALNQDKTWADYYNYHHARLGPDSRVATERLVYTEGVVICKTDDGDPKRMAPKDWVKVDVITIAAPDLGKADLTDEKLSECHITRARHMLTVAAAKGVDILVLGAFGCGAFHNDPVVVARAYKKVLAEFPKVFDKVEFAVVPVGSYNYMIFNEYLG